MKFKLKAEVWMYSGASSWYFVTLSKKVVAEIRRVEKKKRIAWGMIPAKLKIGKTSWETKIFPDKKLGYVLPLKASVRKKEEDIEDGDRVEINIEI